MGPFTFFAGNRFEERSASGQKVKEFPIGGWEYGGKTADGDEVRLTYIEDGWVGQIQTPLGKPSEFLMPGGFHEIAFHSNSNPSQRQDDRFDIKVIGLRKAKEWATFPGNPGEADPQPQGWRGVGRRAVRRLGRSHREERYPAGLSGFRARGCEGHKYKSLVMKTDLREVPFSVDDPGSLKLFRIAGRTLSVEKFAKALGPVAASGTADSKADAVRREIDRIRRSPHEAMPPAQAALAALGGETGIIVANGTEYSLYVYQSGPLAVESWRLRREIRQRFVCPRRLRGCCPRLESSRDPFLWYSHLQR